MKLILLGVLIGLALVQARHYGDRSDFESSDDKSESVDFGRRRDHTGQRHRRRSWQPNYGYDYPQPQNPYYPERRDNQDLLPQILRLLDEISAYVKRPQLPPPPPQPIYVPYPVPYPVPQYCNCNNNVQPPKNNPNVTSRFPDMEDTNQNWGFVVTNDNNDEDDENDGSRPISFVPVKSDRPKNRPVPSLEHGTNQAGDFTTKSPQFSAAAPQAPRLPDKCDLYSLTCCNGSPDQQRQCLINAGCGPTFDSGRGCSKDKLLYIIDQYAKAYSPVH